MCKRGSTIGAGAALKLLFARDGFSPRPSRVFFVGSGLARVRFFPSL